MDGRGTFGEGSSKLCVGEWVEEVVQRYRLPDTRATRALRPLSRAKKTGDKRKGHVWGKG